MTRESPLRNWTPFRKLGTAPEPPVGAQLEPGFDIATYSCEFGAECSPLSCNSVAGGVAVNAHCLFGSFEAGKVRAEKAARSRTANRI